MKRHVMKNTSLKGEIVINVPMVNMKIVANSSEEIYVMKKDVAVKRHAAKNVGSRGKTKIMKAEIMKRHMTKNVGSRRKTT